MRPGGEPPGSGGLSAEGQGWDREDNRTGYLGGQERSVTLKGLSRRWLRVSG